MSNTTVIADQWFELHRLDHRITLIRESHVAGWLRCNIWHVQGRDRDLLIDTGMGVRSLKREISALRDRPVICVSTHAHFDHIGGAHEFACRMGHASEADIHQTPDRLNTGDWAPFVRAETFSALPWAGFDHKTYSVTPAPLTDFLDDGDVIDLGDRHFNILHLPGHSPGSIALLEPRTGTLFSGDTIYDGALYDTAYHSDKTQYQESLRRLKSLPLNVVHGGHFGSFDRSRLRTLIDAYLAGDNTILDPTDWVSRQL